MKAGKNVFTSDLIKSTGDRWDNTYGGYFSDSAPLNSFWSIINKSINFGGLAISIVELGSANANLCQFLVKKLRGHYDKVEAFAVDIQPQSIDSIEENDVKKIVADIRQWQPSLFFDIIVMRSVLHYNNDSDQVIILKNVVKVMSKSSVFFNQLLSGDESTLMLYHKIQKEVFDREVFLFSEEQYLKMAKMIFEESDKIGDCLPIEISGKDMLDRFSIDPIQRKYAWRKMQEVTGWKDENELITLGFPVFRHGI